MFDPSRAIPVMAIAGLMANTARVIAWHREVDWRAVFAYAVPGIPAASLGAISLVNLPAEVSGTLLGLFIMAMVPLRRFLKKQNLKIGRAGLAVAGAIVGFLTGLFLSTGPLSIPAFLAFGLTRGAFLSTEAASSIFVQAAKVLTFRETGVLTGDLLISGRYLLRQALRRQHVGKHLPHHDGCHHAGVGLVANGCGIVWLEGGPVFIGS
jgi:uncharacterized membrane protein YfcA